VELAEKQIMTNYSQTSDIEALETIDYDTSWTIDIKKFRRILVIRFSRGCRQNVLNAISKLNQRSDVLSAEPNFIILSPTMPESTEKLSTVQNLSTPSQASPDQQWGLEIIGVQDAWDITKGLPNIVVGVIDSGIQANHPDLVGRVVAGLSRNFVNGSACSPLVDFDQSNGHGTMTAGIITTNGIGTFGVAPNVRLASLRLWAETGQGNTASDGTSDALIRAIQFASNPLTRIPILNASIQGLNSNYYSILRQAIRQFPGVFIAAAGNHNRNTEIVPNLPSGLRYFSGGPRLSNIISVGASDRFNNRSIWTLYEFGSNYGRTTVDVFAPGGRGNLQNDHNLRTVNLHGGNRYYSGTSAAAPHIAGVVALMLSVNPTLLYSPSLIRQIIIETSDPTSCTYIRNHSVAGLFYGRGILNAYEAVKRARDGEGLTIVNNVVTNFVRPPNFRGHLVIPYGVTQIANNVFANQTSITRVSLPNTLRIIGAQSFFNTRIRELTLPNGLLSIGNSAFANNPYLKNVVIPSSVTVIDFAAFSQVLNLRTITIPFVGWMADSWQSTHFGWIFGASFANTQNSFIPSLLQSVTILGGTVIRSNAFLGTSNISRIELPQSLQTIESQAFAMSGITGIVIPINVRNIGSFAFLSAQRLSTVAIRRTQQSLTELANVNAFAGTSLSRIYVPRGINYRGAPNWNNFALLMVYTSTLGFGGLYWNVSEVAGVGVVEGYSQNSFLRSITNSQGKWQANFDHFGPDSSASTKFVTIRHLSSGNVQTHRINNLHNLSSPIILNDVFNLQNGLYEVYSIIYSSSFRHIFFSIVLAFYVYIPSRLGFQSPYWAIQEVVELAHLIDGYSICCCNFLRSVVQTSNGLRANIGHFGPESSSMLVKYITIRHQMSGEKQIYTIHQWAPSPTYFMLNDLFYLTPGAYEIYTLIYVPHFRWIFFSSVLTFNVSFW